MRANCSASLLCLAVLVLQHCLFTNAFLRRRPTRRLTVEVSDWGDWEEATLVEQEEEGQENQTDETGDHGHWWWKRQSNGATSGTGNVPVAAASSNNLTGGPTANTSGAAGNNSQGIVPGLIGNQPNPNRDLVNCSDVTTGRSEKCWEILNLTEYVTTWINSTICAQGEGFASCFMRQNGFPAFDCSHISPGACTAIQNPLVYTDPKKFYVAYNVYAINAFFTSWWQAVASSAGIASNNIAKIVQIVDIQSSLPVVLQRVLIAFQSIFAVLPGPLGIFAAQRGFSYSYQTFAQVFSNAINIAPNVGRYLFPTGTADSQIVQLAELGNNFGTVLLQIQSNLNQTLTSVMANVTEFLAFASQGNFSANAPSLPDQANYLYYAFNTYIISQGLNGNNVYAVIGRGTNPKELQSNGSQVAYDLKCDDYNELGICDAWWYSELYESAFTLDDFSHMNRNYNKQLNQLLSNLTTGPLLFEAAYQCNSAGQFGGSVNVTATAKGVETACISQLRVLTWDMSCRPGDWNCEFLEQEAQKTFGSNSGQTFGGPHNRYSVPYGYLGPGITSKLYALKRD